MNCNLKIKAYVITNKGLLRENNEDNFYVNGRYMTDAEREKGLEFSVENDKPNQIFAVCDGMGGELMGEVASFMVAKALRGLGIDLDSEEAATEEYKINAINEFIHETNLHLCEVMQKDIKGRMGSTLSGLHVFGGKAIIFNVGDSRTYLFRDSELKQLTSDHTEAERLIRLGVIDEEQAKQHRMKHRLTRHFGILPDEGMLEADISEYEVKKDDIFLLCSDGLTDMISDGRIKEILVKTENKDEIHINLVKEALKNGGYDNVTVILLKVWQEV